MGCNFKFVYKYVLDCLGDSGKLDNSAPFFVGTCFLAAKNDKNSSNFNPRVCFKKPIAHHHPTKTYKSWEFCRSTQIILWHDLASEDAILKDPGIQTEATIVPGNDACWESDGGWLGSKSLGILRRAMVSFRRSLLCSQPWRFGTPRTWKSWKIWKFVQEISWNMNPISRTTCQEFRKKQGCRLGPESSRQSPETS